LDSLAAAKADSNIDIKSAAEFPALGGTPGSKEQVQVVMADVPVDESSNGFWERPLRPVKVAMPEAAAKDFPSMPASKASAPGESAKQPRAAKAVADAEDNTMDRKVRVEELLRHWDLHLDEPVVNFLLSLSSASDVLDYLQAYHGDGENVRRFAEGFAEQRLGMPPKDEAKESTKATKEASDAATPKASRRRRGKGKEVDPSLLGFTAAPSSQRLMHGGMDHNH